MFPTVASLSRATTLALASVFLAASVAAAQTASTQNPIAGGAVLSDAAFRFLLDAKGKEIWITTADGKRSKGQVVSLATSGVTIADPFTREIAFDTIVRVEQVSHWRSNRLVRGGIIGFGSGFGPVALISLTCWGDECAASLVPALAFGAIGTAAGLGIAALMNHGDRNTDVVYQRRANTTFNVAPILSPNRKGVAVSLTWR